MFDFDLIAFCQLSQYQASGISAFYEFKMKLAAVLSKSGGKLE